MCTLVFSAAWFRSAEASAQTPAAAALAAALLPVLSTSQPPILAAVTLPVLQEVTIPEANKDANLRSGPGMNFARIDTVPAGQPLPLVGRNAQGDWVRTNMGAWIAARLVDHVPPDLPVVTGTYAPATQEEIAYLQYVIHWHNQMVYTGDELGEGSDTVSADDMVLLPWQLRDWQQKTSVPPGLADLGEWVKRLAGNCALADDLQVDEDKLFECGRMMGEGFIPAKFASSSTAAPMPGAGPVRTPQASATPAAPASPTSMPKPTPAARPKPIQYEGMLANIWTGVKVYFGNGAEKRYGFEILGGGECSFGKGVYVEYEDGTREWKSREALLYGAFYVRADDPARTAWEWYEYACDQ